VSLVAPPRVGLLAAGAGALMLLTGCAAAGTPGTPDGGGATDAETAVPATDEDRASACVAGEWRADLDDLVGQLAAQLSSTGLPVSGSEAGGSQTLVVREDGTLAFDNDMTLIVTVDLGGVAMSVRQEHTGIMSADWSWADATADGGTMTFASFDDTGYVVQTTFEGDGIDAPAGLLEPPSSSAANVPTAVTCRAGTLTTHPAGTPFTTTWTRNG
jgi:hypothetical protein